VTLCLSPIVFPTGDEFQWGEVGEGLVRAHAVVGMFPMAQLVVEPWWLIGVRVHLIELFVVSAMAAVPTKKSVHIEIVVFMEARSVAFPNYGHFTLLSARLFPSPRRSASRDSCPPSSAIDLAAFQPRS